MVSRAKLSWLDSDQSFHCCPWQRADSDDQRVERLLGQMTLEEKLDYIGGATAMSIRPIPRLGLPEIRMSDGPLGVRQDKPSTRYPAGIALAASWNRDLAQWEGVSIARDCRARGIHVLLAPGVNINRLPICGRNFEYLSGEDPYLASELVVPFIRGVQSQGVTATVKHFAANNQEINRQNYQCDRERKSLARDLFAGVRGSCSNRESRCGHGCLQQSEWRLLYGEQFSQQFRAEGRMGI